MLHATVPEVNSTVALPFLLNQEDDNTPGIDI
jgi:hypothetical protein